MTLTPKVSVIIPAYNVRSYLADALLSLEHQKERDFEAIVVDDGSTDGTPEVVQPFVLRDNRFRLLQKPNGGLSSARNYGIRHARAEYIALLDGDDAYHPDKLTNHVARLDANPQVGVVYSASRVIRDDGRKTFIYLSGKPVNSNPIVALLLKNFVGHGSNAVFRRSLFDEVGEFDEGLRSNEDVDFWLRIAATHRWQFYRERRALCYYRVRPSGLSFNVEQMQSSAEKMIAAACCRSREEVEPMLPKVRAYMYRYLARLCLQGGDTARAKDFIAKAWECDRSIFYTDPRSLITLLSVRLTPVAKLAISRSLGAAEYTRK
jgi:glycosyltransferase involved in cell wall biosynthesis